MTDHEATKRLAASLMDQLSQAEKAACHRCKSALEKVLRKHGPISLVAFGVLAVELQDEGLKTKVLTAKEEPESDGTQPD
jgi:hypothetical protein